MKTLNILSIIFIVSSISAAKAQQNELVADQNPRYKESQQRYVRLADSLTKSQGVTIQNTYKAYDFYLARLERRSQNREWRHQENLYRPVYYGGGYSYGAYSPYSWSGSSFWLRPSASYHRGYYHYW